MPLLPPRKVLKLLGYMAEVAGDFSFRTLLVEATSGYNQTRLAPVNGQPFLYRLDKSVILLDLRRTDRGFLRIKYGCGRGVC
jgi:hypothetical protein